jgi:alpha-glucoside transport system substrate-binding protein
VNVKSLIWYVPDRFAEAGYSVPTTWDELLALSDRIVADGGTPWCFAVNSAEATGWPATDLVEDLLLHEAGPEVYDAWVAGEVPFSHPAVRRAFERFGELAFTDGYVHGGILTAAQHAVLGRPPATAGGPARVLAVPLAELQRGHLPPGVEFGRDVAVFPTPAISEEHAGVALMGGDLALVFTDRPEVRAVVEYLASPAFGEVAANAFWFLAANRRFDPANYPDEWRRDLAADLARGQDRDLVRFDGSDLMHAGARDPPVLGGDGRLPARRPRVPRRDPRAARRCGGGAELSNGHRDRCAREGRRWVSGTRAAPDPRATRSRRPRRP